MHGYIFTPLDTKLKTMSVATIEPRERTKDSMRRQHRKAVRAVSSFLEIYPVSYPKAHRQSSPSCTPRLSSPKNTRLLDRPEQICNRTNASYCVHEAVPAPSQRGHCYTGYVSPMHFSNSAKTSMSFTIVRNTNSCMYDGNSARLVPN